MKMLIVLITLLHITFIYSQDNIRKISGDGIFVERYITMNPELDFISAFEDSMYQGDLNGVRVCKINFDFNFDGLQDIALTNSRFWGAHIIPWEIYLGIDNNNYQFLDELWFHNDAVRFDSLSNGKSKVIVFDRAGGANVDIVEYLLSKEGINQIERNTLNFEDFEGMNDAFVKFRFPKLKDSCITITDYLMNKNIEWREGY
jgi:hypothetical protein